MKRTRAWVARSEAGLSQKKAATGIGISRSYLAKIEKGHEPSDEIMEKIGRFYGWPENAPMVDSITATEGEVGRTKSRRPFDRRPAA